MPDNIDNTIARQTPRYGYARAGRYDGGGVLLRIIRAFLPMVYLPI